VSAQSPLFASGQFQIEIKGLTEPKSKEAARIICQEDLNEVIAAFVQDRTAIERGIFDDELVPEELTQVRMGKIIKDKYPDAGPPENTVTISASGYPLSVTSVRLSFSSATMHQRSATAAPPQARPPAIAPCRSGQAKLSS
jgi:hypothetical protein